MEEQRKKKERDMAKRMAAEHQIKKLVSAFFLSLSLGSQSILRELTTFLGERAP